MGTFLSAYLIVWSVLAIHVLWLIANQRDLERRARAVRPSMGKISSSSRRDSNEDGGLT